MPKSILVTGCLGYLGGTVCRHLLENDYDVVGVDNCRYKNGDVLTSLVGYDNFQFQFEDMRWPSRQFYELARHVDVVIPLAALVGAPICEKYPIEADDVNSLAISRLVGCLGPQQHVIYPNSNSGYGQTNGTSFCVEEDELKPISVYGTTKCEAEKFVRQSNASSTVFRLATVFGASPRMRMDLMVNDFTRQLTYLRESGCLPNKSVYEHHFEIFDPHFKRNFVHVKDVARAFIYAIENRLTGVYNLGLPTANLTKLQLAHLICDELRLSRKAICTGEGQDPDQRNYLVSNDKILATGFTFQNSLQKGIREVRDICLNVSEDRTNLMRNA